jgi:hypothetical protein
VTNRKPAVVDAVIKQGAWLGSEHVTHLPIRCGQVVSAVGDICGGDLGRIWRIDVSKDDAQDLFNPDKQHGHVSGGIGPGNSIGTVDLLLGAVYLKRAHVSQTRDGTRFTIWLAEHPKTAYRRLRSGEYEVLRMRDPGREPKRVVRANIGLTQPLAYDRLSGRRSFPPEIHARLLELRGINDGTPFGLGEGGMGVLGDRPAVPATIICPECKTPNLVRPVEFDVNCGKWHTVR